MEGERLFSGSWIMSDKLERDVEEVLAGIEDFDWRRRERRPGPLRRAMGRLGRRLSAGAARLSAGQLMLLGSLVVIVGFVLRGNSLGMWGLILGVVLFVIGLAWSARGGGRKERGPTTRGGYWRDRYISYDEPPGNPLSRWFRRRDR